MWTLGRRQHRGFWLKNSGRGEACLPSLRGWSASQILQTEDHPGELWSEPSTVFASSQLPGTNFSSSPSPGNNGLGNSLANSRWMKLNWGNLFIHFIIPPSQGKVLEFLINKSLTPSKSIILLFFFFKPKKIWSRYIVMSYSAKGSKSSCWVNLVQSTEGNPHTQDWDRVLLKTSLHLSLYQTSS